MTNLQIDKKAGVLMGVSLIIGLLVGGAIGVHGDRDRFEGRYGKTNGEGTMMHGAMQGMMSGLYGKQGDEFDKAFLSEMIVHHQGAVVMAQQALTNAKHQEIKDMAGKIISAQQAEIQQMQTWQGSWYSATPTTPAQ